MEAQYGEKKGKQVFYATINKGKKGSSVWHKKKNYSREAVKRAMNQ